MAPDCWTLAHAVLPSARRSLLHGFPGTGKTYAGQNHGLKPKQKAYSIYITEYTPVSEPRGNIYPVVKNGNRLYEWQDGPATLAYRHGHRLVINEIDKSSDDCMTFFLALLDDVEVSAITLPTGEVVKPHPNFTVVATMNAKPFALIDPLRDRFPVTVHIDKIAPEAIQSLPPELRQMAIKTATDRVLENRVLLRAWKEFASLRDTVGDEMAAYACFGDQANGLLAAMKAEKVTKEFTGTTPV